MTPPASTEHRYPDPEAGPWKVTLIWELVDGLPECVEVRVRAASGARPVADAAIRKLGIAHRIAVDRARMSINTEPSTTPPPGMRKSAYDRLVRVSRIYKEALVSGSRTPTRAVQEELGISPGHAGNLVFRARGAGLLPPTSPGVALGDVDQGPNVR